MKKLTIIGLGLIGSSVARGLKGKYHITGYNRNTEIAQKALKDGVVNKAAKELHEAVSDADIVMICTPIRFYESIMNEISEYVNPGCIITDVGSVKTATLQRIYNHLPPGVHFIPAHPIAGKEKAGYEAGEPKLFLGKKTILTPLPKAKLEAVQEIENLWKDLGAHTERMTPAEHDKVYATVSHAPQLLAYAFRMALNHKKYALQTAPNGDLKTALRISNSPPDIWVDIFMMNRLHIFAYLEKIFAGLLHIDKFADQVELRQRLGGEPKEFKLSKDPKYDAACIFASLLGNLTLFCTDDEFERGSVSRKFSAANIHQSLAMLDEPMKPEDKKNFEDYSGSGLRDFTAMSLYDVSEHITDFEQEIATLRALVHRKIFEITAAIESDSVELLGQKLNER